LRREPSKDGEIDPAYAGKVREKGKTAVIQQCPECATVVFTLIGNCTNASAKTTMLGYAEIVAMH